MPQVLNLRTNNVQPGRVRVDRKTKWGNPFIIPQNGNREEVIEKYLLYINTRPDLRSALGELRGKDLLCWCAPLSCHADILLALANEDK